MSWPIERAALAAVRVARRCIRLTIRAVCLTFAALALHVSLLSSIGHSAEAMLSFESSKQEALYNRLIQEYRCLKCQNQNLADSAADLAGDLKREIYERVLDGKSSKEIDTYLVSRYGDFVLYRPPFKATTYLLWLGPFVLLAVAMAYAVKLSKRGERAHAQPDDAQMSEARRLLDDT